MAEQQTNLNLDNIKKEIYGNNANPFNTSDGPVMLNRVVGKLNELKTQVNSGSISYSDYQNIAIPLSKEWVDWANNETANGQTRGQNVERNGLFPLRQLAQESQVYSQAKKTLGRDITENDVATFLPYFQGPNGDIQGNAALANLAQQEKLDPNNPNSPLNPTNPAYQSKVNSYSGQVNDLFKNTLGRDATQEEVAHFGSLMASGATDAYTIQGALKQLPEYTNQQDTQFRQGLNKELENYDVSEFGRQKQNVLSQFAQNGLMPGSTPALDYALTDLMGKISQNRSAYLASLSASQYGQNKDLAIGNYQNLLNNSYNQQQQNQQSANNLNNYYLQRAGQGMDYQTQMNDYLNFLKNQPKRSSNTLSNVLAGAGTGALIGGSKYGPYGAGAGALFGYLNS